MNKATAKKKTTRIASSDGRQVYYIAPSHRDRHKRTLDVVFESADDLDDARTKARKEGRTLPALVLYLLRQHWKEQGER